VLWNSSQDVEPLRLIMAIPSLLPSWNMKSLAEDAKALKEERRAFCSDRVTSIRLIPPIPMRLTSWKCAESGRKWRADNVIFAWPKAATPFIFILAFVYTFFGAPYYRSIVGWLADHVFELLPRARHSSCSQQFFTA